MTSPSFVFTAATTVALCLAGMAHAQTCVTDRDCGSGMVCHSQTSTSCSGSGGIAPACPADMLCPDAGAPITTTPVCTETTISSCTYQWLLPCNADPDCGDGFVCQPIAHGVCSSTGSAGGGTVSSGSGSPTSSGAGGAGALPPVAAADAGATSSCVTTTSFPGSCQPKNSACTTDGDCPSPWTCKDVVTGVPEPIAISADAGTYTPPTTATSTSTSVKTCQPPNGSVAIGGRDDNSPAPSLGADAGATTKGTTTPPGTSGAANTTATQTSTQTQTAARTGGGGCSLAKSGSASGAWLALLGLLALRARPRKARH